MLKIRWAPQGLIDWYAVILHLLILCAAGKIDKNVLVQTAIIITFILETGFRRPCAAYESGRLQQAAKVRLYLELSQL
jgi:hypothetical protein